MSEYIETQLEVKFTKGASAQYAVLAAMLEALAQMITGTYVRGSSDRIRVIVDYGVTKDETDE